MFYLSGIYLDYIIYTENQYRTFTKLGTLNPNQKSDLKSDDSFKSIKTK